MNSDKKINPIVAPFNYSRYIIIDADTSEILDDCNGFGYKSIDSATKAIWWKFKNGKEKTEQNKKNYQEWLKIDIHSKFIERINEIILINLKSIIDEEDIIKQVENECNIKFPREFKRYIL